jgi:hypothetical protein
VDRATDFESVCGGSTPPGATSLPWPAAGCPAPRAAALPPASGPCGPALFRSHTETQRRARKPRCESAQGELDGFLEVECAAFGPHPLGFRSELLTGQAEVALEERIPETDVEIGAERLPQRLDCTGEP